MGWEYSDTNCKYRNVCSSSPRCIAKSKNDLNCYKEDDRSFFEKHFRQSISIKWRI